MIQIPGRHKPSQNPSLSLITLLNQKHFLSYLESSGEELVLDFQKVPSVHLSFERFIEDGEPHVILNVLPAGVTMSEVSDGQEEQQL